VKMDPPVPCSPTCEVASLTEGAPRILLMGQTGYCIFCYTVLTLLLIFKWIPGI